MSAVDSVSVQEVLKTLSALHREGKTIIIISHHQNSVTLCSKIYSLLLNKGNFTSVHDRAEYKNEKTIRESVYASVLSSRIFTIVIKTEVN